MVPTGEQTVYLPGSFQGPVCLARGLVGGGVGSCLTEEKGGCKVGSWESRPLKQVLGSSLLKPLPLGYKL